jgi:hypothetical protein
MRRCRGRRSWLDGDIGGENAGQQKAFAQSDNKQRCGKSDKRGHCCRPRKKGCFLLCWRLFGRTPLGGRLLDFRPGCWESAEARAHRPHCLNLGEADRAIVVVLFESPGFRVRQSSLSVPLKPKPSWRSSAMDHVTLPAKRCRSGESCDGGRTRSMAQAAAGQKSNGECAAMKLVVQIRTANVSEEIVASTHTG